MLRLPELNEYYPLQIGRVLFTGSIQRLSLTTANREIPHTMQGDSIADTIRDNANRLSYRVYRFVTDTHLKTVHGSPPELILLRQQATQSRWLT